VYALCSRTITALYFLNYGMLTLGQWGHNTLSNDAFFWIVVLPMPYGLCQRIEQCLGLQQISRVKALGEPAVDGCQQVIGVGTFAPALP
jgi:hypothetical protein